MFRAHAASISNEGVPDGEKIADKIFKASLRRINLTRKRDGNARKFRPRFLLSSNYVKSNF